MADLGAAGAGDEEVPQVQADQPVLRRLPPPPRAEPTTEELQASINEVVACVYTAGVPQGRFTVQRVHEFGLTVEQFVKHTKAVFGGKDADQADLIISAGIKAGVCESVWTLDMQSFWQVIRWARSNDGRQALETRQKVKRLEDKRVGTQTSREVAFCQILSMQMSMMAEEVKEARAKSQQEIDELTRQLRLKRDEQVKMLATIREKFFPANVWVDPTKSDKNNRCWEMYRTAMLNANQQPLPNTEQAFRVAVENYKDYVDTEYKTQFIRSEERQVALAKFADERIHFLSNIGEPKRAGNFRHLLAAVGFEPTPQAATEEEEGDDEIDTGGPTDEALGAGEEPDVGAVPEPPRPTRRRETRDQERGQAPQERRNLRLRTAGGDVNVSIQGAQGDAVTSRPQRRRRQV